MAAFNKFLELLVEYYPVAVGVAAGVVLALFLGRLFRGPRRTSFAGRAAAGGGGAAYLPPEEFPSGIFSSRRKLVIRYEAERLRLQSILNDVSADNAKLKRRIRDLTNELAILAPLIKELNSNLERRKMGPLVLRVLQRLFRLRQALVFFMDRDGETLTLDACCGVSTIEEGYRQLVGTGFAGIVAQKRIVMGRKDLLSESNLIRQKVLEAEPEEFHTDLAAPIVYAGKTLGVLCVGGLESGGEDVRSLLGMVADITALSMTNYRQYRKIEELANSDPLTRIYNKGYFLERGDHELARARREGEPLSILMFDVDHFKHYNDTNGHLAGDRLLRSLAEILKREVRERDTVARFGGEEFVVLLRGVGRGEAVRAAERIRAAVAAHPFLHGEKQPLGLLSVSGGTASMPGDGEVLERLLEKADEAMYRAKRAGRNRIVCASAPREAMERSEEKVIAET